MKFKKPKKRRKIKKRETLKVNVSEVFYVAMFSFQRYSMELREKFNLIFLTSSFVTPFLCSLIASQDFSIAVKIKKVKNSIKSWRFFKTLMG